MAITCTIDAAGITAPALADIRAYFVSKYREIYGADVYLEPDSQDGQMLDLFSVAVHDANAMTVSVFNAFSPSSAQGEGLSRVVKINGIARQSATYSTVDLLLGGTAGTVITSGYATDEANHRWNLPASVTIPNTGQITVTATAATIGAISAAAGTVTTIGSPTRGWQTVTNPLAAVEGDPVETDAALRRRQATSTAIPSQTILGGLVGAVANLPGVVRYGGVENDTSATDDNGVPGHAFSIVVDGGDAATIAAAIFAKKGPGAGTHGTTNETVTDAFGVPHVIRFMRPTEVPISVGISLVALHGYTSNIGDKIKAAVAAYIEGIALGGEIYLTRLYVPANLSGTAEGETYDLVAITIARDGGALGTANIDLAYHETPTCSVSDIVISVA